MSRAAKSARLVVYGPTPVAGREYRIKPRFTTHTFYILANEDGCRIERATGCSLSQELEAQRKLTEYLTERRQLPQRGSGPESVLVTDVLAKYASEKAVNQRDPRSTRSNLANLIPFFAGKTVSQVNGALCRLYVEQRKNRSIQQRGKLLGDAAVRRDLEILQASLNYAAQEGVIPTAPKLAKPMPPKGRDRWLTTTEAATLIRAVRKEPKAKHLIAFILITLHTSARREAVLTLQWAPNSDGGYVDLAREVIDFRPIGWLENKKRRVAIPIPDRIKWLLRVLNKRGGKFVVSGNESFASLKTSWATAVKRSGLPYVKQHELCHTAISWQMQRGPDIWQLSKFTGRSPKMLQERYGHLHPSQLANIARGR